MAALIRQRPRSSPESALDIQDALKKNNDGLPVDRQMVFRIGINLGDVIQDGGRIYGDGVNIAARIEALATGGGICISGSTYEQIQSKVPVLPFTNLSDAPDQDYFSDGITKSTDPRRQY